MTFEEWIEQEKEKGNNLILTRDYNEICAMKQAWDAGYHQGYDQGYECAMDAANR